MRGRRWSRLLLAAALAFLTAGVVLAVVAWRVWTTGPAPLSDQPPVTVLRVAPGATLHHVAGQLQQRGLLRHPRVFLLGARLSGRDHALQVGRYEIPAGASPRQILTLLLTGRPLPVVVQLTEGLEATELARSLADSLDLDPAAILAAADTMIRRGADTLMTVVERRRLAAVIEATGGEREIHWCEGYLAPDTYHFAEGSDAVTVARSVVGLQLARLDSLATGQPFSPHALVTLAAIVEAEAQLAEERSRVAAVYHNRLARGMRLEADPTVAFWLGKRGQRLLYKDLEIDSPYNTYRRGGLPAGPTGCPGTAAMAAAATPDTACRALYFVADGEGGHVFSRTLAEHQEAVERYRRLMRQRRR
jgi:UPF0755 protein